MTKITLFKSNRWILFMCGCMAFAVALIVYDEVRVPPYVHYVEKTGRPTDTAAYRNKGLQISESDNAALLLLEADRLERSKIDRSSYQKLQLPDLTRMYVNEPIPEDLPRKLADYVTFYKDILPLIHKAARCPYFRYIGISLNGTYYTDQMVALTPWEHYLSSSYPILCEGMYALLDENPEHVEYCIETALLLPALLAQEPMRLFYNAANSNAYYAFLLLEHSLNRTALSPGALQRYQSILEMPYYSSLDTMKSVEEYMLACHLEWHRTDKYGANLRTKDMLRLLNAFLLDERNRNDALATIQYILQADSVCLSANKYAGEIARESHSWSLPYSIRRQWGSLLSNDFSANLEPIVRAAVARGALAAMRYYLDHSRLPDTLEDLVPNYLDTVPHDPFTLDDAIRYRIRDIYAVFYSVGPNEQDDGGIEPEKDINKFGDFIFRLPLPEGRHDES